MGILVVTWNFPPRRGGIESVMGALCAGLKNRYSVFVITATARSFGSPEEGIFRSPWPGLIPFALYALWRGAILLHRNPTVGVIFGGSVMMTPVVLVLARLFGRKAIVQAHGLDLVYPSFVYQRVCVRWLGRCDRVVANSSYTGGLAEKKGALQERIFVIPPGIDWQRFQSPVSTEIIKSAFGLEGKRVILFVGRLARRKGVREFLENSFPKIVRHVPDAYFVIVGDNPIESLTQKDDVSSEIKGVISQNQLQSHVRLLGAINDGDVIKLYRLCDVFVLPALPTQYDVEGFGIVLLEAAAAGKAVVATRVGGIPDAVEDSKSGILVEAGDYEAIACSVVELLQHDQARQAMGEYGSERARQYFAWQSVLAKYHSVIDSVTTPSTG